MKLFKKPVRKFNRTTKPNVKKPTALYNRYTRHNEIIVNKTIGAYGGYTTTTNKGKQRMKLDDRLDRQNDKTQYVNRQYRRLRKSLYSTPENRISVSNRDFEKVRAMHIQKYQYSGKKVKVRKNKKR